MEDMYINVDIDEVTICHGGKIKTIKCNNYTGVAKIGTQVIDYLRRKGLLVDVPAYSRPRYQIYLHKRVRVKYNTKAPVYIDDKSLGSPISLMFKAKGILVHKCEHNLDI